MTQHSSANCKSYHDQPSTPTTTPWIIHPPATSFTHFTHPAEHQHHHRSQIQNPEPTCNPTRHGPGVCHDSIAHPRHARHAAQLLPATRPSAPFRTVPPTAYPHTTRIPVMRMEQVEGPSSQFSFPCVFRDSPFAPLPLGLTVLFARIGSHPTHDPSHPASASLMRLWPLSGAASSGASGHLVSLWAALGAHLTVMSYLHRARVAPTFDWGSSMSSCFKGFKGL
ncbi:hypothetical protein ACJZ2D_011370 [Fusarium nematophilum]